MIADMILRTFTNLCLVLLAFCPFFLFSTSHWVLKRILHTLYFSIILNSANLLFPGVAPCSSAFFYSGDAAGSLWMCGCNLAHLQGHFEDVQERRRWGGAGGIVRSSHETSFLCSLPLEVIHVRALTVAQDSFRGVTPLLTCGRVRWGKDSN